MPVCKAAGPDGFNSEFFKSSWDVLKHDLVNSVRSFLKSGIMPSGINSAFIALIPKVKQATRPEGRNIAYNVSLVQELLCKYKRKNVSKRCMIKLDITKAYDMVDWDFLCDIMTAFGFPAQFIMWIRACISTAKFSVVLNDNMEGYFSSNRGLRQGDPISPYLFTLIMEVLSRILSKACSSTEFKFHPKCARINLSHLMFADDVIIFSKANLESLAKIKAALKLFYT
ncbi:hypothetical protein QQ045_029686 [Rhodiola kirilowii]